MLTVHNILFLSLIHIQMCIRDSMNTVNTKNLKHCSSKFPVMMSCGVKISETRLTDHSTQDCMQLQLGKCTLMVKCKTEKNNSCNATESLACLKMNCINGFFRYTKLKIRKQFMSLRKPIYIVIIILLKNSFH